MNENTLENIIALSIVLVVVVVFLGLFNGWFFGAKETQERYTLFTGDDPTLGRENAPVTIIEFSDFSCTFCADFEHQTGPRLKEYIDNGTVLFAFKDFPLTSIHPKAAQVAKAAGCLHEQDLFFEYKEIVYNNLEAQELTHLRQYALDVGADIEEYDSCFASERRFFEIQSDVQEGRLVGVQGTPTFFVNGKRITGVLTNETLDEAISKALTQK